MPEQAEGDKKPVVVADSQESQVSSPPKAPAKPPEKKQEQKGSDEERLRTLETKISDLSLQNATLKATITEQEVLGAGADDSEIISDIDISDSQINAITQDGETNPAIIKDRIKGVVTETLNQAQRQQAKVQRKQIQVQAEYRKFTDDIFEHKPHLKQYEEQIGVFAEAEWKKTGQGIQSILAGVKQFEDKFGHLIDKGDKRKPKTEESVLPDGAVGETEPVVTQPEPKPEEPFDMSPAALIKARTEKQNKQIHG